MGFFDVLDDLFDDVLGLFGGADDDDSDDGTLRQVVSEFTGPPPGPPPPAPPGPSGLQGGADQAGTTYQQSSGAVSSTDDRLAESLRQIFASNDQVRAQISGIVDAIKAAQQQLVADPSKATDPHSMAYFNEFLDQQLGKIQQVLEGAKVDSKKQAELLAALGDEYRKHGGGDDRSTDNAGQGGGSDQGGGGSSGGGGGDSGGSGSSQGGGSDPGAGAGGGAAPADAGGGLMDPLAGLGGLGGLGGGDPFSSMLGPALAGLGSIPGALGGAGSLPASALGALGDQLGGRDGGVDGDGFSDRDSRGHGKSDFVDAGSHGDNADSGGAGDSGGGKPKAGGNQGASGPQGGSGASTDPNQPQPAQQPAASAAVPASAAGDPSLVVPMPDGTPVTATSPQHATAVRAVLGGASVADGWKQANVSLPPPGTPVTTPGDPSHLVPGEIAQYKSRDPVMYAGNGKIWLDGQLQPQSALPTGDFLGWLDPAQPAGPAPVVAGSPALTATSGS